MIERSKITELRDQLIQQRDNQLGQVNQTAGAIAVLEKVLAWPEPAVVEPPADSPASMPT